MIKTGGYIKSLMNHGLVDDAVGVDGGWDIQYKNNIVSVRLDDKGGALIYNKRNNDVIEIKSGRLDDVLHRFIVQSLFGLQNKVGVKKNVYRDAFFVPSKVVNNLVIFEDPVGRKFTVEGASPRAVLNFYDEAAAVGADDCVLLLSGFKPYTRDCAPKTAGIKDLDVETQILKSSLDLDDYSVMPDVRLINDVGQTIVGNFLCSSADKVSMMTFNEDLKKVFSSNAVAKRGITSNAVRVRNPLALKAKKELASAAGRKALCEYLNSKYPEGLCVSSLEQVMAYESPSIMKAANVESDISYKGLFSTYLQNSESAAFRLDSNKSILCTLSVPGKSAAKFRAIPDLSLMKSSLSRCGYLLSELSNGLEFDSTNEAVSVIVNHCSNFTPVSEKMVNKVNLVSKLNGQEVRSELSNYGIDDKEGVFSSLVQIVLN